MQISKEDAAIIESALREAMNSTLDYRAGLSYRQMLSRFQQLNTESGISADLGGENAVRSGTPEGVMDGFRYVQNDNRWTV